MFTFHFGTLREYKGLPLPNMEFAENVLIAYRADPEFFERERGAKIHFQLANLSSAIMGIK